MVKEFIGFLREFKVMALAIGFILATASTTLVNSLVKDILMPLLSPLLPGETWRLATYQIGSITLAYGSFIAEVINFTILALIVFIVGKKLFKLEVEKK
jgi:large conductance mechanosensitive channel